MFQYNKEEPTYSIRDCQDILGKEKSTLYRMIHNNILPTLDVSPIRVTKSQLRSAMLCLAPRSSSLWGNDHKS